MKKLTAIVLSVLMLLTVAFSASAAGEPYTKAEPDLIITEVIPNSEGSTASGVVGYVDGEGADAFECFEIYNNSGKELNLYDYCIFYCGSAHTSASYEAAVVEITPFLTGNKWENKPGNYLDGTTLPWSGQSNACCDLSNMPTNPEKCIIKPGECVVVWSLYSDAYFAKWNEGKGMSINDFRKYWGIADSVQVIAWDGMSSEAYGGHDKNFNLKNSDTGCYGIAKYSEELNTATNVKGSKIEAAFASLDYLVSWSTVNFKDSVFGYKCKGNQGANFVLDYNGDGAEYYSAKTKKEHAYDARRGIILTQNFDATLGELNDIQKLMFKSYKFSNGETITLPTAEQAAALAPIFKNGIEGMMISDSGIVIDGKTYDFGSEYTFTVAVEETTTPEETTPVETVPEATTPAETKPGDTSVPTGDNAVYAVIAFACLAVIGCAVICKKKVND